MSGVEATDHDIRRLAYRVRVELVAEVVDTETGEVIASGDEAPMKELYRSLKKGEPMLTVEAMLVVACLLIIALITRGGEEGRRASASELASARAVGGAR